MEKNTPVRKPNASTADLLTWSENAPADSPVIGSAARSSVRSHQVQFFNFSLLSRQFLGKFSWICELMIWLNYSRRMELVKLCLEDRLLMKKLKVWIKGLRSIFYYLFLIFIQFLLYVLVFLNLCCWVIKIVLIWFD